MVYLAAQGELESLPRIERIGWNPFTGAPEFPIAHGNGHPQQVPSGQ